MRQCSSEGENAEWNVSAQHVKNGWPGAKVVDSQQLHAGHRPKYLASEVVCSASGGGGEPEWLLVGIFLLNVRNQLGHVFGRNRRMNHHRITLSGDLRDRQKLFERFVVGPLEENRRSNDWAVPNQEQVVAVGCALDDHIGTDDAGRTRLVIYHNRLAPLL